MINFDVGERKNIWIEIKEREGKKFNIRSANCAIYDSSGKKLAEGLATIEGQKIYSLVDSSKLGPNRIYQARFIYIVGNETLVERIFFKVVGISGRA